MLQVPPCHVLRIFVDAGLLLENNIWYDNVLRSVGSLAAVRLLLEKKRGNVLERRDSLGGGAVWGGGGDRSGGSAAGDINALSSSNVTALHIATSHRYMEIVKLLLLVPAQPLVPPPIPPNLTFPVFRMGRTPTRSLAAAAVHWSFVCSRLWHRCMTLAEAMNHLGRSQVLRLDTLQLAARACLFLTPSCCSRCVTGFSPRVPWRTFDSKRQISFA